MNSNEVKTVYEFLLHSPEAGVRRMLMDQMNFGDSYVRMALKIVRACKADEFAAHFEQGDFPRMKMGPADLEIRDSFWPHFKATLESRGLLSPQGRVLVH